MVPTGMGLFRKRDKGHDPFKGDALEAQIVELAVAVPVENSNQQTEAIVLAGPTELLGGVEAFQSRPNGEQAVAASYAWLGWGLRSAELQIVDGSYDPENPSWEPVAQHALIAARAFGAEDMGPAVVAGARAFCAEGGKRVLFQAVPGLPAATRERIIENYLRMEEGGDNALLSHADREKLIVYGFAAAAVREHLLINQEREQVP
jgi:hypothetical protein